MKERNQPIEAESYRQEQFVILERRILGNKMIVRLTSDEAEDATKSIHKAGPLWRVRASVGSWPTGDVVLFRSLADTTSVKEL